MHSSSCHHNHDNDHDNDDDDNDDDEVCLRASFHVIEQRGDGVGETQKEKKDRR